METAQATPTKLRNGSWGAKVQSTNVREGDVVTIITRGGKSWDAQVSRVLWIGDAVAICATESLEGKPARSRSVGSSGNCSRCCRTATRTAQIWEDCPYCGAEPVYM